MVYKEVPSLGTLAQRIESKHDATKSQAEDQDQVEQRQAVYSGVTIHNLGG